MEIKLPLQIILATFLAIVVAGCGDQAIDPIMQEQDYDSTEGMPTIFMSAAGFGLPGDPYLSFRFKVAIEDIFQEGFYEVIMPDTRVDLSEFEEGGESAVDTEYGNLILMWGVTSNTDLYDWFASVVDGNVVKKSLSVVLMNDLNEDAARWNFTEAWPTMYHAPDLNAGESGVAIETLEISFTSMERVE